MPMHVTISCVPGFDISGWFWSGAFDTMWVEVGSKRKVDKGFVLCFAGENIQCLGATCQEGDVEVLNSLASSILLVVSAYRTMSPTRARPG